MKFIKFILTLILIYYMWIYIIDHGNSQHNNPHTENTPQMVGKRKLIDNDPQTNATTNLDSYHDSKDD